MGRRRTVNKHLPPRMKVSKGAFSYDHGIINDKRTYTPLGRDYPTALKLWAELAGEQANQGTTWGDASTRYRREILSTKEPKTQASYSAALDSLDAVFFTVPLDEITAAVAGEYLRLRSVKRADPKTGKMRGGPVIAAREMAVLSLVFNLARDWGYTNAANPRYGKRLPKSQRDVYIEDDVYWRIYEHGDELLQDFMDVLYQMGQRPSDTLRLPKPVDGWFRNVKPRKTAKRGRRKVSIEVVGELKVVVDRILARPRKIDSVRLFQTAKGGAVTLQMMQRRWSAARAAAGIELEAAQLRDIRAKTASDLEDLAKAQELLVHSTQATTENYIRGRVGKRVQPLDRKILGEKRKIGGAG